MNFKQLLDSKEYPFSGAPVIAFLGDSVTQGCFEIYKKENNEIETIFDKQYSYEKYVFDIISKDKILNIFLIYLNLLYINI